MKNKTAEQLFLTSEAIIVITGIIFAWLWKRLPPQLPWFYSLPSGEQQLVSKLILAIVLGGAAILIFITRMIAKWAAQDSPVETTVMTGGLIATVLLAAGFFRVLQIIIGL